MKSLKLALLLFAGLLLAAAFLILQVPQTKAENGVTAAEHAELYVNDLAGFVADGGTRDAATGNITNVSSYGRVGFNDKYQNVAITSVINFSTVGNTTFVLRAQGDSLAPAGSGEWENQGYYVRWYPHGQFDFVKNGTALLGSPFWGTLPGAATPGVDYTVVFKTADMSDGSVQVTFSINGYVIFDYNDADSPLTEGGWYAITSEGSEFSASGSGFQMPVVDLSHTSQPIYSANFPASIDQDGVVTTSGSFSGAGYAFQTSSAFVYKTIVKPVANVSASSSFSFTIGATKTNSAEINRPNVVDANWGWSETGYVLYWHSTGSGSIGRAGGTISSFSLPQFAAGESYEIEYGVTNFGDGSVRVHLKINGDLAAIYFDRAHDDYTPLSFPSAGGSPASLVTYSMVLSYEMDGQILPCSAKDFSQFSLASKDLGSPMTIGGAGMFDRNGSVSSFGGGIVAGYNNGNINNASISMKANFSAAAGNLVFTLASQGSLDTPWGSGWSRRGYQIYFYANGQVGLFKNAQVIFEGWALSGFTLATDTEYLLEIGTINLDGAIQVYAKIGDVFVLNYLDTENAFTDGGWLSIYSGGFAGSLGMTYDKPQIIVESTDINAGSPVSLSYSSDSADDSDNVEYFIDTANSTAEGAIDGNQLTATSAGIINVYVCVNGIYSDNVAINVSAAPEAYVTNLPTSPIIVGGESHIVGGKLSTDDEITSMVFSIENVTGRASIDQSGRITAEAAGTVRVFVTINGIRSEGYLLSISPQIEIGNTGAMAVGEVRKLSYWANCDLPDEDITATYELVSGQDVVTLDSASGNITALKIGVFTIRVTLIGQSFTAVSAVVSIPVEAPIVVLHGVKDMYVGQTITLDPRINEGVPEIPGSKEIVITKGQELVNVDGVSITALGEGIIRLYAKINGISSKEYEIAITPLQVTIIAGDMPVNSTQTLDVIFNFDDVSKENVKYSIIEGQTLATLDGNILTSLGNTGKVKLQAVVNDTFTATTEINITSNVRLQGISDKQQVVIGSEVNISFIYLSDDEVISVELKILEGKGNVSVTEVEPSEGQDLREKQFLLSATGTGKVRIQLVVNGIASEEIEFNVYKDGNLLHDYLILIAFVIVAIVLIIAGLTTWIVVKKKKKRLAAEGNTIKTNEEGVNE